MKLDDTAENVYQLLTNEEDARSCRDINDEACRETPRNFVLLLIAYFSTKLGDALSSPKTVLPWVMSSVGAPVALTSFLVPIRESGSLIPQLAIASWVRTRAVRKWIWIAGALLQSFAVIGIGAAAMMLSGAAAGWTILASLALFSLSRGLSSVASKDVLGKTVPKARRGQLTGWSAGFAGLVTVGVGIVVMLPVAPSDSPVFLGMALIGAGLLWLVAAFVFSLIKEYPGETDGGVNGAMEAFERLTILRSDRPFRRFVITRALLLCSALSAPFYVVLAKDLVANPGALLGLFVLASGTASLVSAPIWGRFADVSSRRVMIVATTIASVTGMSVVAVASLFPALAGEAWLLPAGFFVLSVAHGGVRVGRKTYVVDLGRGNKRTDYVAVSNSVIGVLLLLTGGLGALTSLVSVPATIVLLALMGLAGGVLATTLPEVE